MKKSTPILNHKIIIDELRESIKGYNPSDKGFLQESKSEDLYKLSLFCSKYPETINSKIFTSHLNKITNRQDLCSLFFKKSQKENNFKQSVSFFLRTYSGDICWLKLLFKSLEEFAPNIPIIVCTEKKDLLSVEKHIPTHAKLVVEESFCKGTIQQKYSKLTADFYCETEWVIYLDSDSILTRPFELKYWLNNDRPYLEYTTLDDINKWFIENNIKNGNPSVWCKGVSNALGAPVEIEYSRRLEKIYKTSWLKEMRECIEYNHKISFKNFMSKQYGIKSSDDSKGTVYFSDFNYMGAFLWHHKRHEVVWINTSILGFWLRPLSAAQFHSYSMTINNNGEKKLNKIPEEFFNLILNLWKYSKCEQKIEKKTQELYLELRNKYRY